MSEAIDVTNVSGFLGPVTNVTFQSDTDVSVEIPVQQTSVVPGASITIPLNVPGFHKCINPKIQGILVLTFPYTPSFPGPEQFSTTTTLNAFLEGQTTVSCPFKGNIGDNGDVVFSRLGVSLNPYALGFHDKIGVLSLFESIRLTTDGQIIDEAANEMDMAKWVEKAAASMVPYDFKVLDHDLHSNICQPQDIDQTVGIVPGINGTRMLTSSRINGQNLEIRLALNIPIPFFLGNDWPLMLMGSKPQLEFTLSSDFYKIFFAPSRTYTSRMNTADDFYSCSSATIQNTNVKPIQSVAFATNVYSNGATGTSCDMTGSLQVMLNSLKLTTTDLEDIIGQSSTWCYDGDRIIMPQCEIYRSGLTIFSRLVHASYLTTQNQTILRDQYSKTFIHASQIAAIVRGSSYYTDATSAASSDPAYQPSSVSEDSNVYIIFREPQCFVIPVYGAPFLANGQSDIMVNSATVTVATSSTALQLSCFGFEFVIQTNQPFNATAIGLSSILSGAEQSQQAILPLSSNIGLLSYGIQQFENTGAPNFSMIYPTSVSMEQVSFNAVYRTLTPKVFSTIQEAYKSAKGYRISTTAPVFTSLNQTTNGFHQFFTTFFNSEVAFMQFEVYRTNTYVLGSTRMLPFQPFAKASLKQGSYLVLSTDESQYESFGSKFPLTIIAAGEKSGYNWQGTAETPAKTQFTPSYTIMPSGVIGETDLYDTMVSGWMNAFAPGVLKSINLSALHKMRSHWGITYAMNSFDGTVGLPGETTFLLEYVTQDYLYANSQDIGNSYLSNYIFPTFEATTKPYTLYTDSVNFITCITSDAPAENISVRLQDFLTNLPPQCSFAPSYSSPTQITVILWGTREYVFQEAKFRGIAPTTVVTVNA